MLVKVRGKNLNGKTVNQMGRNHHLAQAGIWFPSPLCKPLQTILFFIYLLIFYFLFYSGISLSRLCLLSCLL